MSSSRSLLTSFEEFPPLVHQLLGDVTVTTHLVWRVPAPRPPAPRWCRLRGHYSPRLKSSRPSSTSSWVMSSSRSLLTSFEEFPPLVHQLPGDVVFAVTTHLVWRVPAPRPPAPRWCRLRGHYSPRLKSSRPSSTSSWVMSSSRSLLTSFKEFPPLVHQLLGDVVFAVTTHLVWRVPAPRPPAPGWCRLRGHYSPRLKSSRPSSTSSWVMSSSRSLLTSFEEFPPLVHQLLGDVVFADELLEADEMQAAAGEVEVGGDAQQDDRDREVDVEAVGDERDHVHVAHDLSTAGHNMIWAQQGIWPEHSRAHDLSTAGHNMIWAQQGTTWSEHSRARHDLSTAGHNMIWAQQGTWSEHSRAQHDLGTAGHNMIWAQQGTTWSEHSRAQHDLGTAGHNMIWAQQGTTWSEHSRAHDLSTAGHNMIWAQQGTWSEHSRAQHDLSTAGHNMIGAQHKNKYQQW